MNFAGINYWAVSFAGAGGFATGALWYWAFATPWMAASGVSARDAKAGATPWLFARALVAQMIIAWVLAGIVGHLGAGQVTLRNGVISGAFCWLGFVIAPMIVRDGFSMRDPRLLLIDGGYWLAVLLLMGAVIGGLGVR
ncbi:MAG: DUF1761 domain-containing protein [Proteobacteria bacterium]|nr:DUF1761 domain-containing protein [Pseudomonadota bacterium]